MSLGSGHVWQTKPSRFGLDGIECTGCGRRRNFPLALRHGKRARVRMVTPGGRRPLGTCKAGSYTAQRRAKGEAEIRATLERFE